MIKISNIETYGWETAVRGMRNPMNSWDRSDSKYCYDYDVCEQCPAYKVVDVNTPLMCTQNELSEYVIGPNDLKLMLNLAKAGSDHAKFRRMITVTMDILAPLYWWKEFDTYKVGTVANSCSTMHKIAEKEFTLEDFSTEHLISNEPVTVFENGDAFIYYFGSTDQQFTASNLDVLAIVVEALNIARNRFLETKDKTYWWQMIQLLPSSYNQLRTVQLNYEVLANIYRSRKDHKLDEWGELCKMIERLPHSEIITLKGVEK